MKILTLVVFSMALSLSSKTQAESPHKELINPENLYQSKYYTQAVSSDARRIVYISGQWAYNEKGELQGKGDLRAQAVLACKHLGAILKAANLSPEDVLKITVYIVNYKMTDLDALEAGLTACFGEKRDFASTLVGVEALARDGMLFEIEAIAQAK